MQPPESSGDGSATPTRRQLQGPRPPQLKVRRESHSIRKPPKAPPPPPQPVIIYSVSPKVIHTTVSDFMSLVQRLTGSSSAGDVSPAARLASIERTSPTDREKHREILISNDDDDGDAIMGGMVQVEGVHQIPGILSPAPATLPPISPGFFAPGAGSDPYSLSLLQDQYLISPSIHGNMFMLSPSSTLFSAPIVSPSPSSLDLFNPFFDF